MGEQACTSNSASSAVVFHLRGTGNRNRANGWGHTARNNALAVTISGSLGLDFVAPKFHAGVYIRGSELLS